MSFGQVVVGPPGAGKTTYCQGMQLFLEGLERPTLLVNLDPANENVPYKCDINIDELITLDDVMAEFDLGPNGGLMYCMEYLEKNLDWLTDKLDDKEDHYVIFDCPGQVELYTHHTSMQAILKALESMGFRLTCVHLVDSYYCSSASNYIGAVALSLSVMLQLELPHVNVLSKIDLVEKFGRLDVSLELYASAQNLDQLTYALDKSFPSQRFKKLNKALIELIDEFGLVSFETLNIQDKESVWKLLLVVDKANGYAFSGILSGDAKSKIDKLVLEEKLDFEYFHVAEVQEKFGISDFDLADEKTKETADGAKK